MTTTEPGIYRQGLDFEISFTRIPNEWARDPGISLKAKGLLTYLMSHEIGYSITFAQIERENADGRAALRATVGELVDAGYLSTERTTDARGYNAGLAYTIKNPKFENPTLDNPTLENRTAYKENNLIKKTTILRTYAHAEREREFETFWSLYPRKVGKGAALKAFIKARADTPWMAVYDGVIRLDADPHKPETRFIPHPATWLAQGRWMDAPYSAPRISREEQNRRNLEDYGTNE